MSQKFKTNTNSSEIVEQKVIDSAKNKKIKVENANVEESKLKEEGKDNKEDFQNSYVLTMSQSICDLDKTEDIEHMFEPFTQVKSSWRRS